MTNLIETMARAMAARDGDSDHGAWEDSARAALAAIEAAGYCVVSKKDIERARDGLQFGALRLEHTYGENRNVDFLHLMRDAADRLAAAPKVTT